MLRVCHQARLTVERPSRCVSNPRCARPSGNYTLISLTEQELSVATLPPAKQRERQSKDAVHRNKSVKLRWELHNNEQDYKWLYPKRSRKQERIRAPSLKHLQWMNETKISKQAFNYTRKRRQENGRPKNEMDSGRQNRKCFFISTWRWL